MSARYRSVFRAIPLGLAILAGSAQIAVSAPAMPPASPWEFLKDSYWTVPADNLRAYVTTGSLPTPIPSEDQTVYHITEYRDGYFWGSNATSINHNVTCAALMGSVTPEGRVLLSFVTTASDGTTSQQVGYGQMTLKNGAWTMLNQTAAPNFAHWAYMVQSKPGDASWKRLPGVGQSVGDFLGQCGKS
jgi:hypothetical protein